jgi:hypothetical protein
MTVAANTINIVKESMQRCLAQPLFMDRFYEAFMMLPWVQEKFKNSNMAMQKIVLKSSLHLMLNVAKGSPGASMHKLAILHDRNNRDVLPEQYQHWLNAMVNAVKATDTQFTSEIEMAWRDVMQPGINFMSGQY